MDMQDYVHVNKYHIQGIINKISSKMTALDDKNYLLNNSSNAQHQKYIGNHSQTIPIKILATNFTVPAKFGKNDLHSSISTAVVQKGQVILATNNCSLAKSEK